MATFSEGELVLKMREYTEQELVDSLEFVEVLKLDKDGNLVIKKVY